MMLFASPTVVLGAAALALRTPVRRGISAVVVGGSISLLVFLSASTLIDVVGYVCGETAAWLVRASGQPT